jgi:hypothetical protein
MKSANSAWSDTYGTKIVLKCNKYYNLSIKREKMKKIINKMQISVHKVYIWDIKVKS